MRGVFLEPIPIVPAKDAVLNLEEQMAQVIDPLLNKILYIGDPALLETLEEILSDFKEKGLFPFPISVQQHFLKTFLKVRYSLCPQTIKRLALLDRLESLIGKEERQKDDQNAMRAYATQSLSDNAIHFPTEVPVFLDYVVPIFLHESNIAQQEWIYSIAQQCLEKLARLADKNPKFLEQANAFKKWDLFQKNPFHDYSSRYRVWINAQVATYGLSCDPRLMERDLQCFVGGNYDRYLLELYENRRMFPEKRLKELLDLSPEEASFERLGDVVGSAYGRGGMRVALETLVATSASPEEKERIYLHLLHCRSIFQSSFDPQSTDVSINSRGHVQQVVLETASQVRLTTRTMYLEALSQLGLSQERVEECTQEFFAAYIEKIHAVPDGVLHGTKIPINWSHPTIRMACERATAGMIAKHEDLVYTSAPAHLKPPYFFPFTEGSALFQKEFQREKDPELVRRITAISTIEQRPAELKKRFIEVFAGASLYGQEAAIQWVLRYPAFIVDFCKEDAEFSEVYQHWLALCVGQGHWPLSVIADRPGSTFPNWPTELYRIVLRNAFKGVTVEQLFSELIALVPAKAVELQELISEEIEEYLPTAFTKREGEQSLMEYVLAHHSDLLRKVVSGDEGINNEYQLWVAEVYENNEVPDVLERFPLVQSDRLPIQYAVARRLLNELRSEEVSSEFLEENTLRSKAHAALVHWNDKEFQTGICDVLHNVLVCIGGVYLSDPKMGAHWIQRFEEYTGYRLTDPKYWAPFWQKHEKLLNLPVYLENLEAWTALEKVCGSEAGEREHLHELVRTQVEKSCVDIDNDEPHVEHYLKLKQRFGIQPSAESLRARFASMMTRSGDPGDSIELMNALGVSLAFSPEQILELGPTSSRTEAFFATTILPKGGPERAAAEKALRGRSWLANIMPQLLAIQSPTRREEFCPYVHELDPLVQLLDDPASEIKEEDRPKALLFFVQRFGMVYLPELAKVLIPLFLETKNGQLPVDRTSFNVRSLEGLIGANQLTTPLSFEEYLVRIEETMQMVRTAVLEDKPLAPYIQQSPLGIEFFNAVVPHTGTYHSVSDRPALLATVRQNEKLLQKDEIYVPSVKPVRIVRTEKESIIDEDASLAVQRDIRSRREQQDQKYKGEELQKYLAKWEQASLQTELESTGGSRAFWFSPLVERYQVRKEALAKKREESQHQIASERIEKEITKVMLLQERASKIMMNGTLGTPEELLEELQSLYVNSAGKIDRVALESEAGDIARALTLIVMREHSPIHQEFIHAARGDAGLNEQRMVGRPVLLDKSQVVAWTSLFEDEYLEHFAGLRSQAQIPLSDINRRLFQKLWRIDGLEKDLQGEAPTKSIGHPIVDSMGAIRRLEKEIVSLEEQGIVYEEKLVGFWPVKGIGRVLAGDIADACYNDYRRELAAGDYPEITAVLFTIPDHKEIAGSVLFIDTETVSARRVLVIRALNPTDSVTRRLLDSRSFVLATIEYAEEIAKRTKGTSDPIQEVRICFDHRGGHSTNREEIFLAESRLAEQHEWEFGEELVNSPATNFNDYDIYDPEQTRVVWRAKTFTEFLDSIAIPQPTE